MTNGNQLREEIEKVVDDWDRVDSLTTLFKEHSDQRLREFGENLVKGWREVSPREKFTVSAIITSLEESLDAELGDK